MFLIGLTKMVGDFLNTSGPTFATLVLWLMIVILFITKPSSDSTEEEIDDDWW
jgi:hypothetical protein